MFEFALENIVRYNNLRVLFLKLRVGISVYWVLGSPAWISQSGKRKSNESV